MDDDGCIAGIINVRCFLFSMKPICLDPKWLGVLKDEKFAHTGLTMVNCNEMDLRGTSSCYFHG